MDVTPLYRTLEQELFAVFRGASLECLVCGEFLLHHGRSITCPECGTTLDGDSAVSGRPVEAQAS